MNETPMGMRTAEGSVYTEVSVRKELMMNEAIEEVPAESESAAAEAKDGCPVGAIEEV